MVRDTIEKKNLRKTSSLIYHFTLSFFLCSTQNFSTPSLSTSQHSSRLILSEWRRCHFSSGHTSRFLYFSCRYSSSRPISSGKYTVEKYRKNSSSQGSAHLYFSFFRILWPSSFHGRHSSIVVSDLPSIQYSRSHGVWASLLSLHSVSLSISMSWYSSQRRVSSRISSSLRLYPISSRRHSILLSSWL